MINPTKRTGRPTKASTPGERMSLGLKVTAEVKDRLDRAARASGRTQSQEAEMRLERSFEREALLPELLELAYGRYVAGLLLALGRAMDLAGFAAELQRLYPTGPIYDGIVTRYADRAWPHSRGAHGQARRAADIVLDGLWPSADSSDQEPESIRLGTDKLAEVIVEVAKGRRPEILESDTLMASAREFLKPIIKKSARPKKASQDSGNG